MRILQDQNILQDKQIKELAKHLNLTMAHVNRHETMLYELDSKLTILNRTLQSIMAELSYFRYENNLIDNMQMHINLFIMLPLGPRGSTIPLKDTIPLGPRWVF